MTALLSIQDLQVAFRLGERGAKTVVPAVKGVSFDIPENTTLALVGESGSGKSVTAMSILNLLPDNAQRSGRILWQGRDLLTASRPELQALRGREIACVFQDPMSSLNPVFSIGAQLCEPLVKHLGMGKRAALSRAEELLAETGLPEPKRRLAAYPHELSGGQQQRVMIAMALACEPKLLIADEPTTALDVTIQAQILTLLRDLQRDTGMSVMLITHDLGVVAEVADHVVVMYAGRVVETARTVDLFARPQHPYTRGLMGSLPGVRKRDESATARQQDGSRRRLTTIRGVVPDLRALPTGCRFRDRCDVAIDVCAAEEPGLLGRGEHRAACWVAEVAQ